MKVGNIHLAGIGSHVPTTVPVHDAVREGLLDRTAAEESGIISVAVESELPAVDMAVAAARRAIAMSGHSAEDFAALLHGGAYHQGPEGWSAPHYISHRTIDRPVTAFEVRHGCLSVLSAVRMAAALLDAEADGKAALITAADNFSTPLVDRWRDSEHVLYADSGCSLVLSARGGFARLLAVGSRSEPSLEAMHRGGISLLPPERHPERPMLVEPRLKAWAERPGAEPLDMITSVARYGELVAETAEQTLDEAGIGWDDITRVAHLGLNEDALHNLLLDPIDIDPVKQGIWEYIRTIGHASVSDMVLGLEHLWTTGQVVVGDHVLLVGGTEGMEAGCAVVRITAPPCG
ncbi:3-oxoacyl-[acyl-carrier-protein] synthase III C-terminal domain-containing protein [Streptomyces sp. NPDC041068]|uniref:3-oxoacyl-[acyl-carrier-protein] synthase III C-terminal domain-containing protein n=1 Tax=Streptomyces sp. NPDC041068 TaxID=3155130 RepID=UPI0033C05AC5